MLIYTQTSLSIRNTEIPRQKANEWELGKDIGTLILRTGELGIQLLGPQMYGGLALGGSRDGLLEALFIVSTSPTESIKAEEVDSAEDASRTYQLLKNTAVELHLGLPALP